MEPCQIQLLNGSAFQEYLRTRFKHQDLLKNFKFATFESIAKSEAAGVRLTHHQTPLISPPFLQPWFAINTASLRLWHFLLSPSNTSGVQGSPQALTQQISSALDGHIRDPSTQLISDVIYDHARHAFQTYLNPVWAHILDPNCQASKNAYSNYWSFISRNVGRELHYAKVSSDDLETADIISNFHLRVAALSSTSVLVPLWFPALEGYTRGTLVRSHVGARSVRGGSRSHLGC